MNCRFFTAMAVLVVMCSAMQTSGQSSKPSTAAVEKAQQAVRASEQKWLEALFRLDTAALEPEEAADFTLITPAMIFSRKAHLSSMRMQMSQGAAPGSPPAFVVSNQTIRIYGDVAVVSDICSIEGDANSAAITAGRYWQTEVWKKEGEKWKIVHVHLSMMKHGM
jgi:ketosteroid isomerase-like protein